MLAGNAIAQWGPVFLERFVLRSLGHTLLHTIMICAICRGPTSQAASGEDHGVS